MKTLFYLNSFFIGIPIVLCLGGILHSDLFFWGLWSLFPLGIFQSISGIIVCIKNYKQIQYQLYVYGLLLFGVLCLFESILAFILPIPLALYFTFMIYNNPNKKVLV